MAFKVAGGTKWWQVRAGPGVEAEWIVMKKDWKERRAGREKEVHASKNKGREKHKTQGMTAEEGKEEGMVGEDGGVDEDGGCE
jgi:hypothetical protein